MAVICDRRCSKEKRVVSRMVIRMIQRIMFHDACGIRDFVLCDKIR